MPPKLFKASDVCKMAEVQLYVLRSWEKEFPGIGVESTAEGGRLYRQGDVEQVRRIRRLVFDEGLTVSGARRRLEVVGVQAPVSKEEAAEVLHALGADARTRVVGVRDSLQSILSMLSAEPGQEEFRLRAVGVTPAAERARTVAARSKKAAVRKTSPKSNRTPKRKRASA